MCNEQICFLKKAAEIGKLLGPVSVEAVSVSLSPLPTSVRQMVHGGCPDASG